MKKISVALAVYNEERYLRKCLRSIKNFADEIVIVDGGSEDNTLAIASKFTSRIIQTNNPPLFHINKQKALDACTGEWILQLDADEIVSEKLIKEIQSLLSSDSHKAGYYIPRRNIFWGYKMKKTGVYPDYVIRLFKNKKGYFPCKSVHEQIVIDGEVGYLKEPLIHYSYETIADYWRKANTYTSLTAQEYKQKNIPIDIGSLFTYVLVKPIHVFFTLFIRNLGFIDGVYGFLFSYFSSLHEPIAFIKYCMSKK